MYDEKEEGKVKLKILKNRCGLNLGKINKGSHSDFFHADILITNI